MGSTQRHPSSNSRTFNIHIRSTIPNSPQPANGRLDPTGEHTVQFQQFTIEQQSNKQQTEINQAILLRLVRDVN